MYRTIQGPLRGCPPPTGMGFSFKPPKWLRNAVSKAVGIVTQAQNTVDAANAANSPGRPPQGGYGTEMPSWVLPLGIAAAAFLLLKDRK